MPEQRQEADQPPKCRYPKLPCHGILHYLRGKIENRHRDYLFRQAVRWHGPPCLGLEDIPGMRIGEIESCCNKTAPIYILPGDSTSLWDWRLLLVVLHNYLYRTWFRPYRSEIDWGQFLAQVIKVRPGPAPQTTESPVGAARLAASMSCGICAHVEETQQKLGDRWYGVMCLEEAVALAKELGFPDSERINQQKFLVLQPLFRAVAIVLRSSDYGTAVPAIAEIPALLVLTGVEEGLSAPITFDSIADKIGAHHQAGDSIQTVETSLATAVGFLMDLEKRELAAFGPRPDPADSCRGPRRSLFLDEEEICFWAQQHGSEWDEAPEGPSSSWVDIGIYPHWAGEGARSDEKMAQGWERQSAGSPRTLRLLFSRTFFDLSDEGRTRAGQRAMLV
ncbi:hypothetical protein C8A01DRAFT_12426 [Parachaetomium inaequale]|uniref:Uncharacterized protein n=1 Tax=Parachaetomium inaequale TaxID=2588326 RepID=A0AAN6SVH7_9PEZI|nr:hypothetical protein C8A01DRAFT_12426 [Parachaetomium inaequale]